MEPGEAGIRERRESRALSIQYINIHLIPVLIMVPLPLSIPDGPNETVPADLKFRHSSPIPLSFHHGHTSLVLPDTQKLFPGNCIADLP